MAFVAAVAASPEAHRRAAGQRVLAVLAEGCADTMKKRLADVLPPVLTA